MESMSKGQIQTKQNDGMKGRQTKGKN